MTLFFLGFGVWCGYLALEALSLKRWRASIPLRITVTGTRGKTTLVRLLASVLREDGRQVLAKTTGSQASLILPDGSEESVRRGRLPSILEQIRLLRRGASLGVEEVVAEVMSVHSENHATESRRILQPHLVLVTNFRVDHTEAAGPTREDVALHHLLDVPPGARVMIPEGELLQAFSAGVSEAGGILEPVPARDGGDQGATQFPEILELAWAAGRSLEVPDGTIERGILSARGDVGELRVAWFGGVGEGEGGVVANSFAANDPESTALALDWVQGRVAVQREGGGEGEVAHPTLGILNLRRDRGDRTLQWIEALENGAMEEIHQIFLTGFHGAAARRRLERGRWGGRVVILKEKDPATATKEVLAHSPGASPLIFGFGNMGGMGETLAAYWGHEGRPLSEMPYGA